jgi:F420H(2)-dependent quinone reductase
MTTEGHQASKPRETITMALTFNSQTREVVVCSAWGAGTDWIRNLRANPALRIEIGSASYLPSHRFLSEDESVAVAVDFRNRHPWRLRLFSRILGWGKLESDQALRELVRTRPFVLFRPREAATASCAAAGDPVSL